MKTCIPCLFFLLMFNSLLSDFSNAQSLSIQPLQVSGFCAGDPIAVNFSASGFWGHRNAFTLQLSDPSGSFANGFQNIGSIIDTLPGNFTIKTSIPTPITTSLHYRLRILGAIPYIASSDNGQDISIGTRPIPFGLDHIPLAVKVGILANFPTDGPDFSQDSIFWDYGADANPAMSAYLLQDDFTTAGTIYTKPGEKKITVRLVSPGGCSQTESITIHAYDCSTPSIPKYARVVDSNNFPAIYSMTYWVNPGITFIPVGNDTVFSEPGSTVNNGGNCIIYLKHGAVYRADVFTTNVIIYADGASAPSNFNYLINCPTLDFDYTNAPPNSAHPIESLKNDVNSVSITLSPNPTTGIISVQGLPSDNMTISVFNILGEMVMMQKNPPAPDFTLDLTKLVPGTYYIRFSSPNLVVTKMVVRQ